MIRVRASFHVLTLGKPRASGDDPKKAGDTVMISG